MQIGNRLQLDQERAALLAIADRFIFDPTVPAGVDLPTSHPLRRAARLACRLQRQDHVDALLVIRVGCCWRSAHMGVIYGRGA